MSKFRSVLILAMCVAFAGFFLSLPIGTGLGSRLGWSSSNVIANAQDLHDLVLAPHPDVPIVPGKNIVWCDTLQVAWNQNIETLGAKPSFEKQPAIIDKLNAEDYSKDDLNPDEYGIVTGMVRDGVEKQIRDMLKTRFDGKVEALPALDQLSPDDLVIYCALFTHFSFFPEFQKTGAINFLGKEVQSFGYDKPTSAGSLEPNLDEVTLIRYKDDSNFIVHLIGKTPAKASNVACEVILAKIPPAPTLKQTIDMVLKENSDHDAHENRMMEQDELRIPVFDFRLNGTFPELEGLLFKPSTTAHIQPIRLDSVSQNIQFKMNEKGVEVSSSGELTTVAGIEVRKPRHLVFDRPFLLMLKRPNANQPFLAIWVENSSLLVAN